MRYENPRPVYPNELYHHGIMGQHWGETNGPPYPLGSGAHNRVVRQGREERKALREEKKSARATNKTIRKADKDIERAAFALKAAKSAVERANEKAAKVMFGNKFNGAKFDKAMQNLNSAKSREKFWTDKLNKMTSEQAKLSDSARKENPYVKRALYDYYNKIVVAPGRNGFEMKNVNVADEAFNNYNDRFRNLGIIGGTVKALRDNSYIKSNEKAYGAGKYQQSSDKQAGLDKAKAAYKEQKAARHTGSSVSSDRTNAVNYLVRYGIPKATAQKVVSGKDKDSLADMMKDAYKNPQLLTMGANKLSAAQLERHLYG